MKEQFIGFHGDGHLQSLASYFLNKSTTFVETGTNEGDTVGWVAERFPGLNSYSCESCEDRFRIATHNVGHLRSLQLSNMHSVRFLEHLFASKSEVLHNPITFWLDAHWDESWPLASELKMITQVCQEAFIMVDDCKIPGRSDFGYDTYRDQECSLEYIIGSLSTNPTAVITPTYVKDSAVLFQLRGCVALIYSKAPVALPELLSASFCIHEVAL